MTTSTPPVETFGPASATAGGGALGALVGLSNFIYTIVKDHGHQCTFTTKDGGAGVSTVPKDLPVQIESRWEHGGVWYTHTRAWHAAAKGLYSHTTTKKPTDLTSSYLCIVFPFKITYAVAVPDVLALKAEVATLEVDLRKAKLEARKDVLKSIAELDKSLPVVPDEPEKPKEYRTPEQRGQARRRTDRDATEAEAAYEKELAAYNKAKAKHDKGKAAMKYDEMVVLINDLAKGQAKLVSAKKDLLKRKRTFVHDVERHADVKYMTNVHLSGADGWHGLPSKVWQNVKVNASMTVRANEVTLGDSPTVSIDLTWGESAIGYGKSWTGTITLAPEVEAITGSGKFATRFKQLAKLQKVT